MYVELQTRIDLRNVAQVATAVAAHTINSVFLGDDLLAFLVLAFGGALFAGNLLAVVKPPERQLDDTHLERAPVARSLGFALIGLVAAIWAIASLVS